MRFPRDASWNDTAVRLVDFNRTANTFLFRSAVPRSPKGGFALSELVAAFSKQLEDELNVYVNAGPILIDINFLDPAKPLEANDIDEERRWFAADRERGEFHNWPLYGVDSEEFQRDCTSCFSQDPTELPEPKRRSAAGRFGEWTHREQLTTRLEQAHALVHAQKTASARPVFIFGHCECGCDRTGEFFGAYAMRFNGASFSTAMIDNLAIVEGQRHRMMLHPNYQALLWYCWHLRYSARAELDDCGHLPSVDEATVEHGQSRWGHTSMLIPPP